ncbi:NAD(P)H-binding protein [Streptomyces sp. KMM 9044]|uniref:NAD(P)H-binding protein n=1 Tax=Streptomyces sp. KMM 9044 TaxID=2744474 RepID=UPI002150AB36|nr:NAD(P)H-binding protein [Streptomyces sp. KMM 9044]WAX76405.1 NAD(P)H-binding protein [Streptomyces sp. KMM 9044]
MDATGPGRATDGERSLGVCIVGASGKSVTYMVRHALERGYEVVGVCRERSVPRLDGFAVRMTVVAGPTDDREAIRRAVAGCDAVLTALAPWGVRGYASKTAQAVLGLAPAGARLVFSCGRHITRDGKDAHSLKLRALVVVFGTAGTAGALRRPARPGGGTPPRLRRRHPLNGRTRERSGGGRGPGLPGVVGDHLHCGAGTSVPRFSRTTSPGGSTSRCSWWRRSPTTN